MSNTKTIAKTKTKTNRLTIAQSTELFSLKKKIKSTHEAVESFVKSAKDKSRQALAEAITCGKALLRVKEIVGHGQFEKWCAANCKSISQPTRSRYMKLAKDSHVNDLNKSGGLRQAYIALGIINEDEPTNRGTLTTSTTSESQQEAGATNRAATLTAPQSKDLAPHANNIAKAAGKGEIKTVAPSISKADHLSRLKFLRDEILGELNNKITIKGMTLSDLEANALTPIVNWFKQQAKKN